MIGISYLPETLQSFIFVLSSIQPIGHHPAYDCIALEMLFRIERIEAQGFTKTEFLEKVTSSVRLTLSEYNRDIDPPDDLLNDTVSHLVEARLCAMKRYVENISE
jgi:hypothetical protein